LLESVAIAVVLRYVPPERPSWRALAPPAMAVAVFLWAFTNAFVVVQARLVGSLELFSGFAVVLATMIWLSVGFQVLLMGAAWTHVREPGPVRPLGFSVPAPDDSVQDLDPSPPAPGGSQSTPDGDRPS
jgi:uncharacterized BrkB/YihY/UPF0761 family membrane protein